MKFDSGGRHYRDFGQNWLPASFTEQTRGYVEQELPQPPLASGSLGCFSQLVSFGFSGHFHIPVHTQSPDREIFEIAVIPQVKNLWKSCPRVEWLIPHTIFTLMTNKPIHAANYT